MHLWLTTKSCGMGQRHHMPEGTARDGLRAEFSDRRARQIQIRADFMADYILGDRGRRADLGSCLLLILSDEVSSALAVPMLDDVTVHGQAAPAFLERPRYAVFGGWASGRLRGVPISVLCLPTGLLWPEYGLRALRGSTVRYLVVLADLSATAPGIAVGDLVAPTSAIRDEGMTDAHMPRQVPATPDWPLLREVVQAARQSGRPMHVGLCWSSGAWLADRGEQAWTYTAHHGLLGNSLPVSSALMLGQLEGFQTAALCVAAENVVSGRAGLPGEEQPAWQAGWQAACQAGLEALASMPPTPASLSAPPRT
jgi:uridine phosphorylase